MRQARTRADASDQAHQNRPPSEKSPAPLRFPFPNPPPGLLANDQTIRFQFGFFLELTGRPGMRLFRSGQ